MGKEKRHLILSRVVGNDHFCDTTKRDSQRVTPPYTGGDSLRSGNKPLDPTNPALKPLIAKVGIRSNPENPNTSRKSTEGSRLGGIERYGCKNQKEVQLQTGLLSGAGSTHFSADAGILIIRSVGLQQDAALATRESRTRRRNPSLEKSSSGCGLRSRWRKLPSDSKGKPCLKKEKRGEVTSIH